MHKPWEWVIFPEPTGGPVSAHTRITALGGWSHKMVMVKKGQLHFRGSSKEDGVASSHQTQLILYSRFESECVETSSRLHIKKIYYWNTH